MKTLSLENVNANKILDMTKKPSKEINIGLPHLPELSLRPYSNNHRLVASNTSFILPLIAVVIGLSIIGFGGYTGYGMWQTKVQNDALKEMEESTQRLAEEQAQQQKALLDQQRQEEEAIAEQQRLEAEALAEQEAAEVELNQDEALPNSPPEIR
jgi:hypothetical protein